VAWSNRYAIVGYSNDKMCIEMFDPANTAVESITTMAGDGWRNGWRIGKSLFHLLVLRL